jgi:hypothetical protein
MTGGPQADNEAGRAVPYHRVLGDVAAECDRQDALWGERDYPDGTGRPGDDKKAARLRMGDAGATWRDFLAWKTGEVFAGSSPEQLRAGLVRVAAVCVAWAGDLDRRISRIGEICDCGQEITPGMPPHLMCYPGMN